MKKKIQTMPKEDAIGENLASPFADLKVNLPPPPEPPKPPPPPPPTREEILESELSSADKALLGEFRKNGNLPESIGTDKKPEEPAKGPVLKFVIQRKGHKGKTVTLVHGFKEMGTGDRMLLCSDVKTALGIGARFVEAVLELQGDQRTRAAAWFEAKNFQCIIP